jgi:hypothetical protein
VIRANALNYSLKIARIQGKIRGLSLPSGNHLLNVHFANDSALTHELTQQPMKGNLYA